MPVKITIKGNTEKNEYQDALVLKRILEADFIDGKVNGEILIISNATLFGQETKDVDLIVIGWFEKFSCEVKSKAVTFTKQELELEKRKVFVNNFCFVIETKGHIAEDVQLNGITLLVRYNKKFSDVTTQSENQKYILKRFFEDRLNFSLYICNFIWFRNISWDSIKDLLSNNEKLFDKHNYLPNTFSLKFLFQLACVQQRPYNSIDKVSGKPKGYSFFDCLKKGQKFDFAEMQSIFDLFNKVKQGIGQLTRKKIEQITGKLLDQQLYAQAIGEKLIIISGRAGTGKTIKLLRIACDLAFNENARCLILTYNHALVSDIKRTLALAEIPDGIDTYTVNISTLHKFFYHLLIGFGVVKIKFNPDESISYIPDYLDKYDKYINELLEYIDAGLIQDKEIQDLMRNRHDQVAWDYILIDEAQDWSEMEKRIIFRIFGREKVIVADGLDQLVRNQSKLNWAKGLKRDIDFRTTNEKKGLRQEFNLVTFVNSYAEKIGIPWELEPKQELIGGKIIVSTKGYFKDLHERELARCKQYGNVPYEMMFLVPPTLVKRTKIEGDYGKEKVLREFKLLNDFKLMGIDIWDGTNTDLRT
jgi:hypothetical protein